MENFFKEAGGEFETEDIFCIMIKMAFTTTHTHRNKYNI